MKKSAALFIGYILFLFGSFHFSAKAQVYNFSLKSHQDLEVALVNQLCCYQKLYLEWKHGYVGESNQQHMRFSAAKGFPAISTAVGVSGNKVGINNFTHYRSLSASLLYWKLISEKFYLSAGARIRYANSQSPDGTFELYDFNLDHVGSALYETNNVLLNYRFCISAKESNFYIVFSGLNYKLAGDPESPFKKYHTATVGNINNIWNKEAKEKLNATFIIEHQPDGAILPGYFINGAYYVNVNRRGLVWAGIGGGYLVNRYWQMTPYIQYYHSLKKGAADQRIVVKIAVDLKFHYWPAKHNYYVPFVSIAYIG